MVATRAKTKFQAGESLYYELGSTDNSWKDLTRHYPYLDKLDIWALNDAIYLPLPTDAKKQGVNNFKKSDLRAEYDRGNGALYFNAGRLTVTDIGAKFGVSEANLIKFNKTAFRGLTASSKPEKLYIPHLDAWSEKAGAPENPVEGGDESAPKDIDTGDGDDKNPQETA